MLISKPVRSQLVAIQLQANSMYILPILVTNIVCIFSKYVSI